MNDKINITRNDGTVVSADLICFIENVVTGKRYVYYTLNEVVNGNDANSTVKIYVSKVQQNNPQLDTPITEDDWGKLKGYMSDALKGNSNSEIKYVPISELSNPVSVSEKAIAMPTSYDYINKQRGIYAETVAASVPTDVGAASQTVPLAQEPSQPSIPSVPVAPDTLATSTTVTPTAAAVSEPVPAAAQAPAIEPTPVAPTVENVSPVPNVEQNSVVSQFGESTPQVNVSAPAPVVENPADTSSDEGSQAVLEPINITEIEAKYEEMITTINKLKEQEIEAAKRYNATIELSAMHKEQHASFVQEQVMSESVPAQPEPIPFGTLSVEPVSAPAPLDNVVPQAVEPTPVTPVVPEPAPVTPQDLETNWFDMPSNQ